jgi:hypothetical protein
MTEHEAGARSAASAGLRLGALTAADVGAASALSAAFKWPHRREDWRMMLELGTGLAGRDEAGWLKATGLRWDWGAAAATSA